jgi:uncharacterized membrane protein YphA (DoxX/SURF4 family)
MLATWFVYSGVQQYLEPEKVAEKVDPYVQPVLKEAGAEDVKTTDVVKVHAALTVASAAILAMSRTPRTAGLVLAGLTASRVALAHQFWRESDEDKRVEQMELFLKDLSLFGGTLLASTAGHNPKRKERKKAKKAKIKAKKVNDGIAVKAKKK